MDKLYNLTIEEEHDIYGECIEQEIYTDKNETLFFVHNLDECPEDAIIDRDLFTADEYIKAIEFGMKLANDGYTGINVIRTRQ